MKTFPFAALLLTMTASAASRGSYGQNQAWTLQKCIGSALQQNLRIRTDSLKAAQDDALRKTAFDPDKTYFSLGQDPTSGGNNDNALGVTQSFAWPAVYVRQGKVLRQRFLLAEQSKIITISQVVAEIKLNYYGYLYQAEKLKVINYLDSIYTEFSLKASVRVKTGEAGNLELLAVQNKLRETQVLQSQAQTELEQYSLALQELVNSPFPVIPAAGPLTAIPWKAAQDSPDDRNPRVNYLRQQIQLAHAKVGLEKSKLWPDLTIGYSQQLLIAGFNPAHIDRNYFPGTRIGGFELGIALPLFAGPYTARIKAEKIGAALARNQWEAGRRQLQTTWQQALKTYRQHALSLAYYRRSGLKLADEQMRVAQLSFAKGEIGYVELIQNISQATATELNYLSALNQLNKAVIHLQYLQGSLQ